jgi:manganese/zinc/iron transport system substrate-binding protein
MFLLIMLPLNLYLPYFSGMKTHFYLFGICRALGGIFFALLLSLSNGCADQAQQKPKGKLRIVATTSMVGDAVRQIVKDRADLDVLMGAGVDPHLYKATQSDLSKISYANAVFYNGLFLEGKMSDILQKASRQRYVVAISDGINPDLLLHADSAQAAQNAQHAVYDPHIWFDVSLWSKAVAHISNQLQAIDTTNADFYRQNALTYIAELEQLHREIEQGIAQINPEQRVLITSHDAFRYFGRAYNMEVRGLQGISTVTEFGLKDISDMVTFIVSRKIKAVFVESSVPQKSLEAVVMGCKERRWPLNIGGTLYSDAMGESNTPEGTYVGMQRANLKTIVQALK